MLSAIFIILPSLIVSLVSFCFLLILRGSLWVKGAVAVAVFFSLLLSFFYLLAYSFTGRGVDDSVLFHMQYAITFSALVQFWYWVVAGFSLILIICWGLYFAAFRFRQVGNEGRPYFSKSFHIFISFLAVSIALFSVGFHPAFLESRQVINRYYEGGGEDLISSRIGGVDVALVGQPKNFIYLYAESLEKTFFDEKRFPGLLPNLSILSKVAFNVSGIRQAPMTEWTIAGMTASQCGVPLATFSQGRNSMGMMPKFLPGAWCVGDVLSSHGYHLAYMGGADINFAGKINFYRQHGFIDVYGHHELDEAEGISHAKSDWGMYDDDLLRLAFTKFESLSQVGENFGLVLLTLDTHSPHGHETPACVGIEYGDGSSKMLNAVHCADKLISDFVKKILASPYSHDVVLVVGSDHFMMRNDAGLLPGDSSRENLLMIFNSKVGSGNVHREATMLDVAPTILYLMGFDADKFALGRNLFNKEPTLPEELGVEVFYEQLLSWRSNFWRLWKEK